MKSAQHFPVFRNSAGKWPFTVWLTARVRRHGGIQVAFCTFTARLRQIGNRLRFLSLLEFTEEMGKGEVRGVWGGVWGWGVLLL